MTQGIQGTHVQIAGFARLFRTVLTEQNALLRVKIKRGAIVFFTDLAADQLRQKAALAHGAQLKHSLDHMQVGFPLADHIQAVQQQAQFLGSFLPRRRKCRRHLGKIHGKAHPLDGGGNAVKYVAHFRFPDGVHIPAWQQHKFRVAKKPAGAE